MDNNSINKLAVLKKLYKLILAKIIFDYKISFSKSIFCIK